MTTMRETRIQVVREALSGTGWVGDFELPYLAESVVDALFPPDPLIDNVMVGYPGHHLQDRGGWPVCTCGFTIGGTLPAEAEAAVRSHIESYSET